MIEDRIFKELVNEINTLKVSKKLALSDILEDFNNNIVMPSLSDAELLIILKKNKQKLPSLTPALLKEIDILVEVIKLVALMEIAEDWEDFIKLNEKRMAKKKKPKEKPLSGFDKILKGIMQVPKEKKETK